MHFEFNNESSYKKNITLITSIALLSSIACFLVGELLLPLSIAFLSVLYAFEKNRKTVSIITSFVIVFASLAFDLAFGTVSFYALEAISVSIIIAYYFYTLKSKGECIFLSTLVVLAFTFASLYISGAIEAGNYALTSVIDFYKSFFGDLEEKFIQNLTQITVQTQQGVSEALIDAATATMLFNQLINVIFSFIVCCCFAVVGFSLKIFTFLCEKNSKKTETVYTWRFRVTSVVAYFYCAVTLISFFTSANATVFEIVINNLFNIFMFVFFYFGLTFVYYLLTRRRSTLFAVFVLTAAFLFGQILAIELLSFIGVFYTIITNKALSTGQDGNSDNL